jgi:hypothetical protein
MAASSAAAIAGSCVSESSHSRKRSPAPVASSPASSVASGGSTASIASFRMQTAMAVTARGGPGAMRDSAGSTAAAGFRLPSSSARPRMALPAESAVQGVVSATASRISASHPFTGVRARQVSQNSSAAMAATRAPKKARRNRGNSSVTRPPAPARWRPYGMIGTPASASA